MTLTDATLRQITAADPARNTWLSANAGSGKTRVLIDRVARLLLNGVEPQHILCLTYTKAAATEMQNRLFARLGEWAMKPDDKLRAALADLGEGASLPLRLDRARQLFARAIEAPGGLRIQTIHSFCGSLLRRFPLEAGVSPGFVEMDDRAGRQMRSEIVQEMADGPEAHVVRRLTEVQNGEDFDKLVEEIARHRAHFSPPMERAAIWRLFGLPEVVDDAHFLSIALNGTEDWLIAQTLPLLRVGSPTMQDLAKALAGLNLAAPTRADLTVLYDCLLKKDGEPNFNKVPTTKVRTAMDTLVHDFDDFMQRVGDARAAEKALSAAEKTLALHSFAGVFLPEYERRKATRGLLDFDDLILRAKSLLTDRSLAAWVLYRLDGGIEHVLVDEAQDTSPEQWELVEALTAEIVAGEGANERKRTLFVVGDKKQSIYSFQGADVAAFDRMRDHFGMRLASGPGLQESVLEHSFRSSPAILDVVDATFTADQQAALGGGSRHLAFNDALAGRVDVWPVHEKVERPEAGPWYDPVDAPHPEDPQIVLARNIAGWIKARVEGGEVGRGEQVPQVPRGGGPSERPMRYGDVLILVQRRSPLFHEIIRACKTAGLPIAGADRLKLAGVLAVKDLAALLAFLDTPEDDLSLAAVLRSPLCGWTEADLFRLANPRKGYLWEALRDHPGHEATRAFLDDMRGQADFLRPYDLLERVLHRHDGRRKLVGRLGPEAEDGIDEFLSQALSYEALEVPSLTGFLAWMETDEVEVKRQLDAEGDLIRVMTVHGAKGLEAEVVILPDTCDRKVQDWDQIHRLEDGAPVWKVANEDAPEVLAAQREARAARDAAERLRLLYVAMTRARSWLVVCGAGKTTQADGWHNLISAGVAAAGGKPQDDGTLRHSFGAWPGLALRTVAEAVPMALPAWTSAAAPEATRQAKVLSPSDLGGAKSLPGEPEADAKARGSALHLLLERLPGTAPETWPTRAAALIPDPLLLADALPQVRAILGDPGLAPLFGPESLAEVGVTAPWQGHRLVGSIDRLLVGPDRVLIVDFKSNALIPDQVAAIPEGILRQLGAYAHMVAEIYPDRSVETAVLWTRGPVLMPVGPDIVRQALQRTTIP